MSDLAFQRPIFAKRGFTDEVTAQTSTSTTLANNGIHTVTGSTAAPNFTLEAPAAGRKVILACTNGSTSATVTVTLASGSIHSSGNSTALNVMTFNAGNEVIELYGLSTSKYLAVSNTNSVALS